MSVDLAGEYMKHVGDEQKKREGREHRVEATPEGVSGVLEMYKSHEDLDQDRAAIVGAAKNHPDIANKIDDLITTRKIEITTENSDQALSEVNHAKASTTMEVMKKIRRDIDFSNPDLTLQKLAEIKQQHLSTFAELATSRLATEISQIKNVALVDAAQTTFSETELNEFREEIEKAHRAAYTELFSEITDFYKPDDYSNADESRTKLEAITSPDFKNDLVMQFQITLEDADAAVRQLTSVWTKHIEEMQS